MNILYGITGSVAAIKAIRISKELSKIGPVKCVMTEKARFFVERTNGYQLNDFGGPVISEEDEWNWNKIGDDINHISLRDWADILVIAPLTANTLAKMANGICDNLLTSIYRAWSHAPRPVGGRGYAYSKPVVIAPAMNTNMWDHPVTYSQIDTLKKWHWPSLCVVYPVESNLACGTKGVGAMAPVDSIVDIVTHISRRHENGSFIYG